MVKVKGAGFGMWGLEFGNEGIGSGVWGLIWASTWGLGCRVDGLGFKVSILEIGVWGLGFRV